jgi:hypothetical protein
VAGRAFGLFLKILQRVGFSTRFQKRRRQPAIQNHAFHQERTSNLSNIHSMTTLKAGFEISG